MTLSGKIYNMFTADPSTSTNTKNNPENIKVDSNSDQNNCTLINSGPTSTITINPNGDNELSPADDMKNNYNDNNHENFLRTNNATEKFSSIEDIDENLVGIKATTNEKLGPEGREEGISCHSVVLLEKKE